jgi:enterochelin esterase-like enzyme
MMMETPEILIGPRLARLQRAIETGRTTALADFWQEVEQHGTPLIEPAEDDDHVCLVTFVCRAPEEGTLVSVGGQITENDDRVEPMTRVPGTDVWHRTYRLCREQRGEYRLVFGDEDRSDPLNPHRHVLPDGADSLIPGGMVLSELEMPDAPPQPWIAPRPDVAPGRVEQHRFGSSLLGNERLLSVYTPAGYQPAAGPYPLVMLFDRWAYAEGMAGPTTLDNLIAAGALPPVVAVMVSHLNHATRAREMQANPAFAEFLAQELVPWVRLHYSVTQDPARTVIGGVSAGGLTAAYVAWRHPELFGNVLSQSGSFQFAPPGDPEAEWLTRQFADSPRQPLSFYLEAGLLEVATDDPSQPSLLLANRHLRDVLHAKGYPVHYSEFCGAHLFVCWRGTFADGLLALIGGQGKEG